MGSLWVLISTDFLSMKAFIFITYFLCIICFFQAMPKNSENITILPNPTESQQFWERLSTGFFHWCQKNLKKTIFGSLENVWNPCSGVSGEFPKMPKESHIVRPLKYSQKCLKRLCWEFSRNSKKITFGFPRFVESIFTEIKF